VTHLLTAVPDHLSFEAFDRRIRFALTHASKCAGAKAERLMRKALTDGPSKRGAAEAQAWYGDKLPAILRLLDPMIIALNNGIPGFSEWLDRTGYGNDCTMIRALVAWTDHSTGTVPVFQELSDRMNHALRSLN
jgi:hypothetical protein